MTSKDEFTVAAIVYDFDGTLARGNLHERSFIPSVDATSEGFWGEAKKIAKEHDADEVLSYMWLTLEKAKETITKDALKKHGEDAELFEVVPTWFDRFYTLPKSPIRGLIDL